MRALLPGDARQVDREGRMTSHDDELDRRVRALEAERLRPTPPPPKPNAVINYGALFERDEQEQESV